MESKMDAFREFIKKYPKIRQDVLEKKTTWQKVYEDFVILGEEDPVFDIYKKEVSSPLPKLPNINNLINNKDVKNIIEYAKKINPDNISKTLNNVQKVLQIAQSFGSKPKPGLYNGQVNSWWD